MMLMINLKLTTILKAIKIVDDDDKVDFFEKVGKLINTMGLAILEAIMGIEDPNVNLTARNVRSPSSCSISEGVSSLPLISSSASSFRSCWLA